MPPSRVSSKQTKIIFGSNRNKPKQDLFRVCFGLFRCFEPISKQPKQTDLFRNKPKQTETTLNFLKNTHIQGASGIDARFLKFTKTIAEILRE